jgi:hypothetical protein
MIRALHFCVLACVLGLKLLAQPPGQPADEIFSRNKKFSAEVSSERLDRPLLSVFDRRGDTPAHLWSHPLVAEGEEDSQPGLQWDNNGYHRSVSNDGSFVVFRARYYRPDGPALRVVTQKGADKSFDADDLLDVLSDVDNESAAVQPTFLELLPEAEKIYAFWHTQAREWVVLDLETLRLQKPTAAQLPRLNELALAEARDIAREHRPSSFRRALANVAQRAGAFLPRLAPLAGNRPPGSDREAEAAYRYLAFARNPQDRALIEGLLDSELETVNWFAGYDPMGRPAGAPSVLLHSEERALADQLLNQWDGTKADSEEDMEWTGGFNSARKFRHFAGVSGVLHLPFAMPPNAGGVFICLVPAKLSPGEWQSDERVLRLIYQTQNRPGFPGQPRSAPPSFINFTFDTIEPGEYRLKAFWDRRPPQISPAPNVPLTPSPGDYESADSPVLKLLAAQPMTRVDLFCTNRVGTSDEFFADDAKWASENPAQESDPVAAGGPRGQRSKILVSAPVSAWVIKTNENNANVSVKRVQLTSLRTEIGEEGKRLGIRFSIPRIQRGQNSPNLNAELLDDHGCRFETHGYNNSGHIYEMDFATVPLGSRKMIVQVSREDYQDENGRPFRNGARTTRLASFTLTNLFQGLPADWKAENLPAKRDLDLVTVELASFDPQANEYIPRQMAGPEPFNSGMPRSSKNKFTFSREGKPMRGWAKYSGRFIDRWGNEAYNLNQFCQEEDVFKYVVEFARNPEKAVFLEEEKFELVIPKIPGPGESTELNLQKTVQGLSFRIFAISGTGEFTYNDGKVVSARDETDDEDVVPLLGLQGRPVQPKLSIKPGGDGNGMRRMMMMPGGIQSPIIIASRIPHLVIRIANGPRDRLFALLDQDTSVPEPIAALRRRPGAPYFPNQPNEIQYLALDCHPGETNKKLTFTVQKLRKAEFMVRASPNERSRAPGF